MRGLLEDTPATFGEAELGEERVSLWGDSVGAASRQLGVLAAVLAAAYFAGNLLLGR